MGRAKFTEAEFLDAALAVVAEGGPGLLTVANVGARLGAPVGSFYHRFASREVLLGTLWLRTVLDFRRGILAALAARDGLAAALHTPAWVRENPGAARLLLLHDRADFVQGDWPEGLRAEVTAMTAAMGESTAGFALLMFGRDDAQARRLVQFLLAEMPVAAVRQHVRRRERPPVLVDELIATTYRAVVGEHRERSIWGAFTTPG